MMLDTVTLEFYKCRRFGFFESHSANAQVAQLVEHATENRSVGGSNPPLGTIFALSGRRPSARAALAPGRLAP